MRVLSSCELDLVAGGFGGGGGGAGFGGMGGGGFWYWVAPASYFTGETGAYAPGARVAGGGFRPPRAAALQVAVVRLRRLSLRTRLASKAQRRMRSRGAWRV